MVNMAIDLAKSEGYERQPKKRVVIDIQCRREKKKKKTNTVV